MKFFIVSAFDAACENLASFSLSGKPAPANGPVEAAGPPKKPFPAYLLEICKGNFKIFILILLLKIKF
jgi:hypothetical protein